MARYRTGRKKRRKLKLWVKLVLAVLLLLVAGVVLLKIFVPSAVDITHYEQALYPKEYSEYVEKYAAEYGVEEDLIYAVMKTESGFDPEAISEDNARGLMQITSDTFDWISGKLGLTGQYVHDDLHQPELGIRYGTYFLSYLIGEFGDTRCVLAAYHAGRGAVNKWLKDPQYSADGKTLDEIPYADTAHYVSKVLKNYEKYQGLYV